MPTKSADRSIANQRQFMGNRNAYAWALYYIAHTEDPYAELHFMRFLAENPNKDREYAAAMWLAELYRQAHQPANLIDTKNHDRDNFRFFEQSRTAGVLQGN